MASADKLNLKQQVDAYHRILSANKVNDFAVAQQNSRHFIWLFVGFPWWLAGTVGGFVPHTLAQKLKNKVLPFREFSVSFAFTAAFVMWLLWSLIWLVPLLFFMGIGAFLVPVGMAFLQLYAYHYQDYWKEWKQLRQLDKQVEKEHIVAVRTKLMRQVLLGRPSE
jgi:hypothetical protein